MAELIFLLNSVKDFESRKVRILIIPPKNYFSFYEALFQELIIKHHMRGIIVSLNKTYNDYLVAYKFIGAEKLEKNIYVDCASALSGAPLVKDKPNVIALSSVGLSDISIAITEAVNRLEKDNRFLIFDSIATLLIYYPEKDILKFLHVLILKLRQFGVSSFLFSIKQTIDNELSNLLSMVADEYITLPEDKV